MNPSVCSRRRNCPNKKTVYISPLPNFARYKDVAKVLSRHGDLESLTIKSTRTGVCKYCLASFTEENRAQALINLEKIQLYGNFCIVKAALTHDENKQGAVVQGSEDENANPVTVEANNEARAGPSHESAECKASTVILHEDSIVSNDKGEYNADHVVCPYSVIRVEGLPSTWCAKSLFEHLTQCGLKVVNTLVYDDIDELQKRQGLIEFEDIKDAAVACSQKFLRTSQLRLPAIRSVVSSINDMRKSYNGAFTAFGIEDAIIQVVHGGIDTKKTSKALGTYSYSVAEPYEPNFGPGGIGSIAFKLPRKQQFIEPIREAHKSSGGIACDSSPETLYSPQNDMYSPGGIDPITPLSEIEGDGLNYKQGTPKQTVLRYTTRNNGTKVDTAAEVGGDLSVNFKSVIPGSIKCANNEGVFRSFRANTSTGLLHQSIYQGGAALKPSSTVIIDRLSQQFTPNARCLAMWMEQFGEVRAADLVPIGNQFYRAYISFFYPANAENAYYNLSVGDLASHNLQARMA